MANSSFNSGAEATVFVDVWRQRRPVVADAIWQSYRGNGGVGIDYRNQRERDGYVSAWQQGDPHREHGRLQNVGVPKAVKTFGAREQPQRGHDRSTFSGLH